MRGNLLALLTGVLIATSAGAQQPRAGGPSDSDKL